VLKFNFPPDCRPLQQLLLLVNVELKENLQWPSEDLIPGHSAPSQSLYWLVIIVIIIHVNSLLGVFTFWLNSDGNNYKLSAKNNWAEIIHVHNNICKHESKEIDFLNWYSGGVESNWVHSTLRPLIGLLCQPRVIMMEKLVEWLAGETEVLGEKLLQCRFVHHKPHMLPGGEPGPPRWEATV
jgi:hypothetical protein